MEQTFYSNGKLLITGEYTVLDGAKALALPTVFGQSLSVKQNNNEIVSWRSFDSNGTVWIEVDLSFEEIKNNSLYSENPIENRLAEILLEAFRLQPDFLAEKKGYQIETRLSFPREWGLGTSSTLINNLATWLNINPYKLLKNTFNGSGYDIACAQNNSPILYHLNNDEPIAESIDFYPQFHHNLYFVYLNRKQNSKAAIASYYNKQPQLKNTIKSINEITSQILKVKELSQFAYLLEKHEVIMSDVLEMETVKERFFNDFKGVIKSLGAWGGDFVLAVCKDNPTAYFKQKGFEVVIPYSKMILK